MKYVKIKPLLPIYDFYTTKEKVFSARGIDINEIEHYLNTSDKDIIDCNNLDNIKEGAAMLAQHIANNNKIYVVVDCDVDGFTSAALLINYLHWAFPYYTDNYLEYGIHSGKQHGLEDQMDIILNSDYKLVICPDSSSNDYEYHKILKENNIDVLVIDHHEADKYSENAIVINNQLSKNYNNKALSGVGIVYQFCNYLDKILEFEENHADYFLDLVAVGGTADMMDVRSFETKRLIEKGLSAIHNPYLKEAFISADYSVSKYGGKCPHTVGFYISPPINATIRFGELEDKLLVFESMLEHKGEELIPSTKRGCKGQYETRAAQAIRTANSLKRKQDEAVNEVIPALKKYIEDKNLLENKIIAIKCPSGLITNKNITGLAANKLMKEYNHPVMILHEREQDGIKTWQGSARSVETPDFENLKEFMEESGYSLLAAGHKSAFGSSISDENFEEFIAYSNEALADCDFNPCAKVDFIWNATDLNPTDIFDISELKMLYGQGFEEPKVVIENIKLTKDSVQLFGEKCPTLNINIGSNNIRAIKFWAKEDYDKICPSDTGVVTLNILGTCSINEFNGIVNAQIEIEDYEIINKVEYYF